MASEHNLYITTGVDPSRTCGSTDQVSSRPPLPKPVSKYTVSGPTVWPGPTCQLPRCVPVLELVWNNRIHALPSVLLVM